MMKSFGTKQRRRLIGAAVVGCLTPCAAFGAVDYDAQLSRGLETFGQIEATLRVPGTALYAETVNLSGVRSGGINGRAFVWPAATQFRVLNSLVEVDPAAYAPALRQFSDELRAAYWDAGYRSGAGAGDRFYDDNAHLVVSLTEAFNLTKDPVYLTRAQETYDFVLEGEDSAAGGGIYFKQFDFFSKDTISTLQGARAAALLYQATGQASYLSDATRLLTWANSHVQQPNGLFNQGFVIETNSPGGVAIVNAAGVGISANLELYNATDNASYLTEAQRIAATTLGRYFDAATGRINDEGYWAFELVDALADLYVADRNPTWINRIDTALDWLHANKRDANGHYGLFWGRNGPQVGVLNSWSLNEQASVARAYLKTSTTILPGDLNLDGVVTAADIQAFVDGWLADTAGLDFLGQQRAGDVNRDGVTSAADFVALRTAWNDAGVAIPPSVLRMLGAVPEPNAAMVAAIGWLAVAVRCGRR